MANAERKDFAEARPPHNAANLFSQGGGLNPESERAIGALLKDVAQHRKSLLMLDYDGTLAPFCRNPDEAVPYPGIAPRLQAIADTGRTRVIVVSGRDARDILPLLRIEPRLEIWGLHGLQRLTSDGICDLMPMEEHTLDALAEADRALKAERLQSNAEFKLGSIAVHWRGLGQSEAKDLRSRVLARWTPIASSSRLHLMEFDGGLEIRATEADKGDAVLTLLNEMNAVVPAAYLGDDATDEHAFEAMRGRGLSVLVRPQWRPTAASIWLKPPHELDDFFSRWLEACEHEIPENENVVN